MLINATRNYYQYSKCGNSNLLFGAKWQRMTGGGRFLHHWLNVQKARMKQSDRDRMNEWRQKIYQQSSNKLFIECFPYQRKILLVVQVWLINRYTSSFSVYIYILLLYRFSLWSNHVLFQPTEWNQSTQKHSLTLDKN